MTATKKSGLLATRGRRAAFAALCALIVAIVAWLLLRPLSLEAEARRLLQCEKSADGECLAGYLMPEERAAQDVTGAKLSQILAEYVLPAIQPQVLSKPAEENAMPDRFGGTFSIVDRWPSKTGTIQMAVLVAATPGGVECPFMVRDLVFEALVNKYRRSPSEKHILCWIRGIKADAAKLESLGLTGVYDPETKRVVSWGSVRKTFIEKAKAHGLSDERLFEP